MTNKQKLAAANRRSREQLARTSAGCQVGAIGAEVTGTLAEDFLPELPIPGGDVWVLAAMAGASYALSLAGKKGGFGRAAMQTAGAVYTGQALSTLVAGIGGE